MYRPKKHLRAILVACVKPECLQGVVERLVEDVFVYVNEELGCNKWYSRDKFDGNPEGHLLLELVEEDYCIVSHLGNSVLYPTTTHFMYITKP